MATNRCSELLAFLDSSTSDHTHGHPLDSAVEEIGTWLLKAPLDLGAFFLRAIYQCFKMFFFFFLKYSIQILSVQANDLTQSKPHCLQHPGKDIECD